jgi:DNA-binding transcriptional LysR family regulator
MELRHLRYFVAVAETRHFGHAAARLHMAQPPLSHQIRALEDELGVLLLDRTTRRVDLTPAGAAYVERARQILADVDAAGQQARRVAEGLVGRVAIGCVGSATYSLLPKLARSLRESLPEVEATFRGEMLVPDQVDALLAGTIDLGLLRRPLDEHSLVVTTLRNDGFVVLLPDGHRLADNSVVRISDLRDEDFVVHAGRGRSVMHGVVTAMCRTAGFTARVRHEVVETSTLVTFVAAGLGVAVVPEPVAALGVDGATHRPLVATDGQPLPTIELAVATRVGDTAPVLTKARAVLTQLMATR